MDDNEPTKKYLRSSEDAFNKLLWTEGSALDELTVGYLDRFRGMLEEPFKKFAIKRNFEFTKEGKPIRVIDSVNNEFFVPFHRVYFFKRNGEAIWDRKNKINLVWD